VKLNVPQLAGLAIRHGCPDAQVSMAVAVALRESNGDTEAVGDLNNPAQGCTSVGLWQINSCPRRDGQGAPRYGSTPASLKDPDVCAESARVISSGWTKWGPWTTATKARGDAPGIARQLAGYTRDQLAAITLTGNPAPAPTSPGKIGGREDKAPAPATPTVGKMSFPFRAAVFLIGLVLLVLGAIIVNAEAVSKIMAPPTTPTPEPETGEPGSVANSEAPSGEEGLPVA
jgi:hypothetical protein